MPKRDFLAGVIALGQENPKRFLSLIREGWPEIKAAIDHGHTLKVIHQRLVDGGVRMSYRSFTTYVRRIQRESTSSWEEPRKEDPITAMPAEKLEDPVVTAPDVTTAPTPVAESKPESKLEEAANDPYEAIRKHLDRKPPGFHWDEDVPDASKLY